MTMTWKEAKPGKYRLLGPYESFQSRTDAEAWEPYRRVELIESAPE